MIKILYTLFFFTIVTDILFVWYIVNNNIIIHESRTALTITIIYSFKRNIELQ